MARRTCLLIMLSFSLLMLIACNPSPPILGKWKDSFSSADSTLQFYRDHTCKYEFNNIGYNCTWQSMSEKKIKIELNITGGGGYITSEGDYSEGADFHTPELWVTIGGKGLTRFIRE